MQLPGQASDEISPLDTALDLALRHHGPRAGMLGNGGENRRDEQDLAPLTRSKITHGVRSSASVILSYGNLASSFSRCTAASLAASKRHMQRPSPGAKVERM